MFNFLNSSIFLIPGFSTASLHGVMGILTALMTIIFFVSYKLNDNKVSKKLSLFFLFFTLYSASVTTSIIAFPGNMQVAGFGIIIGLYFIMLVAMMGFDTPLFYKHPFFESNAGRMRVIFSMLWGLFSIYGILFQQLPYVGKGNFMYWNMTPICGYGLALLCFLAATGFGYLYISNGNYSDTQNTETYLKMRILAIDGILWSIAGPSYIVGSSFWAISMAFIIMISSFSATAGIFIYYRFKTSLKKTLLV